VARSCEKFGCRQRADVAFGIDRMACVVWLEAYDEDEPRHLNRLCSEHATGLTLPRGWSFDDRRERSPRLFVAPHPTHEAQPPAKVPSKPRRRASNKTGAVPRRTSRDASAPMKRMDGPGLFDPTVPLNSPQLLPLPMVIPIPIAGDATVEITVPVGDTDRVGREESTAAGERPAYVPKFDRTSDVGGALNATGRLLRRAFSSQIKPVVTVDEQPVSDLPEQGDHIDDIDQGDHVE